MEKLRSLMPLSISRITELAEGKHAVVGDLERLAITALCFFDENKSTVKAFQSVGFCLLEREQELEAMQQRAEAAEAALERESDIHIDTAASMREWRLRAEAAEAKLAGLAKQPPVAYTDAEELDIMQKGTYADMFKPCDEYKSDPKWIPLFTRAAPAAGLADLVPEKWTLEQALKMVNDRLEAAHGALGNP